MLAVGHRMNGAQLVDFQMRAAGHLSFSLTPACPLRCRHCLVATVGTGEHERLALSLEQARRYAAQMPALAAAGVRRVSFTGGEPLLARATLAVLSQAAQAAGIECCVVTACHWARTAQQAAEVVSAFPAIGHWHLSMDRYHAEFLPLEHVLHAARAAIAQGRAVVIRAAVPRPPEAEDERLLRQLAAGLPPEARLAVQPLTRAGRATTLDSDDPSRPEPVDGAPELQPWVPCTTTGPLVRADGEMRPCCSGLADAPLPHAFATPRADADLVASYRAWLEDPLLRLVRAVGFAPVIAWVRAASGPQRPSGPVPAHPCDQCLQLWRQPGAREAVRAQLAQPAVRAKIDAVHAAVFGPAPAAATARTPR